MQRLAVLAVLLAVAGFAHAGEVYKWKDANGATHYSQKPPAKGDFTVVKVNKAPTPAATPASAANHAAAPAQASATASASGSTQDAGCERARKNLAILNGSGAVQVDSDRDGKPDKTLNDAERANHLALANAAINANCAP